MRVKEEKGIGYLLSTETGTQGRGVRKERGGRKKGNVYDEQCKYQ